MAFDYYLIIQEHYEDHSEDERTGGEPVYIDDTEHKIDLDSIQTGVKIQVSCHTNIIIQSVTTDPVTIQLLINRGAFNINNTDFQVSVSADEPAYIWDCYNYCDKKIKLEPITR